RNAVRFTGNDCMFEVRFFVEIAALAKSDIALVGTTASETKCLSAFDTLRSSIHKIASKADSRDRRSSYTLTAADFR
ncbi:DUF1488 family protein, partial [Mesorhizobium sp. M7A.F.Ca.US.005.03.2.1]|uniref:DUF1488 family protein n=1 Tax=Mesorhizobium sp. M7A.F.Ca.US.005.03.2.1 TaxID=2496737 RepID=UPI000FCC5B20